MIRKMPKTWGKVEGTKAVNPTYYADGTPCREVEDDWETTGEESMRRLFEGCTQKRTELKLVDKLETIGNLITLCIESLSSSSLVDINSHVINVLHFQVQKEINEIQEELKNL